MVTPPEHRLWQSSRLIRVCRHRDRWYLSEEAPSVRVPPSRLFPQPILSTTEPSEACQCEVVWWPDSTRGEQVGAGGVPEFLYVLSTDGPACSVTATGDRSADWLSNSNVGNSWDYMGVRLVVESRVARPRDGSSHSSRFAAITLAIPGMVRAETSLINLRPGLRRPVVNWGVILIILKHSGEQP